MTQQVYGTKATLTLQNLYFIQMSNLCNQTDVTSNKVELVFLETIDHDQSMSISGRGAGLSRRLKDRCLETIRCQEVMFTDTVIHERNNMSNVKFDHQVTDTLD